MKKRISYEWILFASSVLFFLMSRFLIPRYEAMLNPLEDQKGIPWSTAFLIVAIILAVLFVLRVIWRLRNGARV